MHDFLRKYLIAYNAFLVLFGSNERDRGQDHIILTENFRNYQTNSFNLDKNQFFF